MQHRGKLKNASFKIAEAKELKAGDAPDVSSYKHVDTAWIKNVLPSIAEGAKFVEIVPLYETVSENKFKYGVKAIESFNEKIVGKNGYLGHPTWSQKAGEGYREPVARYIASKTTDVEVVVEGVKKKVKGSQVLAYLSKTQKAQDLFQNIKEQIAGNVSIYGDAVIVYEGNIKAIQYFEELDSIDFVNNSTESVQGAGVTAIVAESFNEEAAETKVKRMDAITVVKLSESAEGREVIKEIESRKVSEISKDFESKMTVAESKSTKLAEEVAALKASIAEKDAEIKKVGESKDRLFAALGKAEAAACVAAEFDALATEEKKVAEAAGNEPNCKLIEIAKRKFASADKLVVAGDDESYSKTKAFIKESIKTEMNSLVEMSKLFGGSTEQKVETVVAESAGATRKQAGISAIDIFGPTFKYAADKAKA